MSKVTKIIKMNGYIQWAKFTPDDMDRSEYHEKTEGQYNGNFFFEQESDLQTYLDAGGPTESMGNKIVKEDESGPGIGKYIKVKRPNVHPSGWDAFGGPPVVFDFREGESTKKWDFEEDGKIGNDTYGSVKLSIYGSGPTATVRLEAFAVKELVEFTEDRVFNADVF